MTITATTEGAATAASGTGASGADAPRSEISRLPLAEREDLPDALGEQLDALASQLGYLPNWAAASALAGEHAQHLNTLLLGLLGRKGALSQEDRDFLALVSSSANGCSYCRLNHIQSYGRAIHDHALATRIGLDDREVPELDDRRRALADFARTVSLDVHALGDDGIERLRAQGLSSEQIIEALFVVIAFAAGNRLTIALNVLPDAQFFED
jgi:uncharacterized peroxidase-related enzyme